MAIPQAVTDVLAALDKATTDVSNKIDALIAQIGTGMTQAEVDQVVSGLQAESDKLEKLAADPANPGPPTP